MDRHKALRRELSLTAHNTPQIDLERLARRLVEAGVKLRDDGEWLEADTAMDSIDGPELSEGVRFEAGWSEAARSFWHGDDGMCQWTGEELTQAELDGADHYRDVYWGLGRVIAAVEAAEGAELGRALDEIARMSRETIAHKETAE